MDFVTRKKRGFHVEKNKNSNQVLMRERSNFANRSQVRSSNPYEPPSRKSSVRTNTSMYENSTFDKNLANKNKTNKKTNDDYIVF